MLSCLGKIEVCFQNFFYARSNQLFRQFLPARTGGLFPFVLLMALRFIAKQSVVFQIVVQSFVLHVFWHCAEVSIYSKFIHKI